MAIVLTPDTPDLESRAYYAGKGTAIPCRKHLPSASACSFNLFNCDTPIPQFVDITDPNDKYKNDWHAFEFEVLEGTLAVGTLTNRNTTEVIELTEANAAAFGTFYPAGTWSEQPDRVGIVIDWKAVQETAGYGCYTLSEKIYSDEVEPELLETIYELCFDLKPYSCQRAHGTIRIETLQKGYIQNGPDYRGMFSTSYTETGLPLLVLGWKEQIRWYGAMYPDKPDEQSDFVVMSSRIEEQIQQKITDKYRIELHRLRSDFGKHLTNNQFLAPEILITDYNSDNYEIYRDKKVRKVSTDEFVVNKMYGGINVTLMFKDMDEGTIQRQFG